MGYTITLDIKSSDFPELGNPAYPAKYNDVKASLPKETKTKVKEKYDSYSRNADRAASIIVNSATPRAMGKSTINNNELCVQFNYQEGTPKTYKFLGMDIDEDYNCVIKLGDGYVIVDSLFDKDRIKEQKIVEPYYGSGFSKETIDLIDATIDSSLTKDIVRSLSTALKTGLLYDLYKTEDMSGNMFTPDEKVMRLINFDPMVTFMKDKMGSTSGGQGVIYKYKSILLNIVDREKNKDLNTKAVDAGLNATDQSSTITAGILTKLFLYWNTLLQDYNKVNAVVSEIDLWSDLGKKTLGEIEFNRRFKKAFDVVNQEDGTVTDRIISFAGVAKDDGILDANLFRSSIYSQLEGVKNVLTGVDNYTRVSMRDMMMGNIDTVAFSNPYELSLEELQAVSSYDSLRYVDEDVNTCMQSYNLDDEEDRSLFIKSAIKSYDRNFRAFKPKDDYDVSQAFADMIEKGITFGEKIVSKSVSTDQDIDKYEVTSSINTINRNSAKKSLVKVGKLLNKSLDAVNDLFGSSNSSAPTVSNP